MGNRFTKQKKEPPLLIEQRTIVCLDYNSDVVSDGEIGIWYGSHERYRQIVLRGYVVNSDEQTINVTIFEPLSGYEIEVIIPDRPGKHQIRSYDAVRLRFR